MRVLQLISSSGLFGAESVLLNLSRALRGRGHEVVVGTFDNSRRRDNELEAIAEREGFITKAFACRGRLDTATLKAIAGFARFAAIDLIHTHGYKADLYGYLAGRSAARGLVATCHNWIRASLSMSLYMKIDLQALRRFDAVAAVSQGVFDRLRRAGVRPEKLALINNGVDPERFCRKEPNRDLLQGLGIGPGSVVVGTVSRLGPLKGLDDLLAAWRRVVGRIPRARLLIVGNGPLGTQLAGLARDLGVADTVVFAGLRGDVPDLLALLDLFVLPSLEEGQPMALLEAMASGRASVATRVGDVPRILGDGACGRLVAPSDPSALADAVLSLLEDDRCREAMGRAAREEVLGHYAVDGMCERYESLYEACLRRSDALRRVPAGHIDRGRRVR